MKSPGRTAASGRKGRPAGSRPKDAGESSRERILRIAIKDFAEKGYAGARIEEICKAAKANPRMLYHYFGDKDNLYIAVLEQVLGELRSEELKLDVAHVAPLDGIIQLFDFTDRHFGGHPELRQLLSGENLLKARFLRRSVKTPIVASPLIRLIDQLLRRGERTGDFRRGFDALQLYVVMVGLAYFHRSNAHTLSVIFQADLATPAWLAEHRRYAHEILTRLLRRDQS